MANQQKDHEDDIGYLADDYIARSTVAFLFLDSGTPRLCGSGTLVRAGKAQGILTCGHVLRSLKTQQRIGICAFPVRPKSRQSISVPVSSFSRDAIEIYDRASAGEGPDLGFVPLLDDVMSGLEAKVSVVDLEVQAQRHAEPPPDCRSFDAVAGAVSEMTPDAEAKGTKLVLGVEGLINIGRAKEVGDNNTGFDLLSFRPKPDNGFKLPDSYTGTSGGGVWRLYVKALEDGTYEVAQRRLIGVGFHQHGENITAHGPASIYLRLLPELRKRWN